MDHQTVTLHKKRSVQAFLSVTALVVLALTSIGTRADSPLPAAAPAVQGAPGANAFPGQATVNAMIVTGGCCHDYTGQSKVIMDTINAVMPVNWTVVQGTGSQPATGLPLFARADWARGFDIVIHNECWANVDLPAEIVRNMTGAGVPRMFFHCALHSYRVMTNDSWRELIGATSRRHTAQHNIQLKWAENDPITAGLPPFVTPMDELYVIEKEWAPFKAIATAVSPEEGHPVFPPVWTHEYRGQRMFGTSLGHGNETFQANQFKELIVRGFRWALKREPIALPPPPAPVRGAGAARGAAAGAPAAGAPPAGAPPAGRGQ